MKLSFGNAFFLLVGTIVLFALAGMTDDKLREQRANEFEGLYEQSGIVYPANIVEATYVTAFIGQEVRYDHAPYMPIGYTKETWHQEQYTRAYRGFYIQLVGENACFGKFTNMALQLNEKTPEGWKTTSTEVIGELQFDDMRTPISKVVASQNMRFTYMPAKYCTDDTIIVSLK